MGYFDYYKPYIYDNLSDEEKRKIGETLYLLTTLNIEKLNVESADVYFSSFSSNDLGIVAEFVKMYSSSIEGMKEIKFEGNNQKFNFLEDIVAVISSDTLWGEIIKKYGKLNSDDLTILLKNKDLPKNKLYVREKLNNSEKEFFDNINKSLVQVEVGDFFTFNGVQNFSDIEKLLECFDLPIVSDEEYEKECMLTSLINDLWEEILPIYTELYRNSIEQGCKGVLIDEGYLYFSNGEVKVGKDIWISKLFDSFRNSKLFNFKITKEFKNLQRSHLIESNYLATYHTLNAFGVIENGDRVNQWSKAINAIKKRFYPIAYSLFTSYEIDNITEVYNNIKGVLTNCIIIEKYDRTVSIQLTYKYENISLEYNNYFENNYKIITGRENCKILKNSSSQNNVISLFGVFDAKKFALEPLFSYQAYDNFVSRGGKVGLDKIIIGRKLDGSDLEFSLKSNDTRITSILAGSGSGKGVMTLGLLSAIVSNKIPFIYLDYKPDMAEMLWEVERSFKNNGITRSDGSEARILAIDAKLDMDTCNPVRQHRFAENLPDYLSDIPNTVFAVLPYLKLLQLYYILGSLRANEENKPMYGGSMTFAILDEFQANIKDNLSKLITTLDGEVKIAKKNADERYAQMSTYVTKLKNLVARLANETGTFINTDGRKSQCRAIYLGQNADYSVWKTDKVLEVANLSSEWYSKTSFRFFGRNGGTGSYAPANTGSIAEFVNNKETFGYWTSAVGAGKVSDVKDWEVFKAYSVLNENDFNINDPSASGRCTSGVLSNIPDESIKNYIINEVFTMEDGNGQKIIRPEIGFLGLVKKLSGFSDMELADAFSEGYEVIWKVMKLYGLDMIYPDIETYLFDASLESIYTTDEIRAGVLNKKDNNGTVGDLSGSVFGEDFFNNDALSDDEKRKKYQQQMEFKKEQEKLEKANKEKNNIIVEINELKSKYGEKISKAGKSLYSYKKDKVLFEDAKKSILDSYQGYLSGFMEVINPIIDLNLKNELISNVTSFLDERFENIRNLTFDTIQEGRSEGGNDGQLGLPSITNDPKKSQASMVNGHIESDINTDDITYNVDDLDDIGNIKAVGQISEKIIQDIKHQYGGMNNIKSIVVNANGALIVNQIAYKPKFPSEFVTSLGLGMQEELKNGKITSIANVGMIIDEIMGNNIYSLTFEDQMLCDSVPFQQELGIKNYNYGSLFRQHKSLQVIYLPNEELTRNNPQSTNRQGAAGKLANLFGFGRGERGSAGYVPSPSKTSGPSLIDRMYESKPVRILTGAFGWTMGIKAVTVAATLFGPWGLIFGGIAAASAYKEIKNDRNNYKTSSRGSSSSKSSKPKSSDKSKDNSEE